MEPAGGGQTRVARGLLSVGGFVVVPVGEVWTQGSVTCFLRVLCRWKASTTPADRLHPPISSEIS